jgi:hypothetical protein
MILGVCTHEREISELLKQGHWPQACAPELRAHVAACRACGELVMVTEAFNKAKAVTIPSAPLPAAGALWWRAQLRRRNTALERVARPLLGAQVFAMAVTLLAGILFLASQARHAHAWMRWLEEILSGLHLEALLPASLPHPEGSFWLLVPVLATLVLLGGVAVYMASEKQ